MGVEVKLEKPFVHLAVWQPPLLSAVVKMMTLLDDGSLILSKCTVYMHPPTQTDAG